MYRRLNIFLIIGAVFTIITGTLLHFVYEWSGESLFVGIFSPINESVWEHLKLLFFPMSVWILIGYFIFGKKFKTYIPSAVIGILSGMILIPMWFYTYTVFTGKPILFLDILSFIISVCVAFFITAHLIENYNILIVAYENEKENTLKQQLKEIKQQINDNSIVKIGIVIGPEGGLEEKDVELLKQNGAKVITLGKRILRTETVALNVLSIIMYELEN